MTKRIGSAAGHFYHCTPKQDFTGLVLRLERFAVRLFAIRRLVSVLADDIDNFGMTLVAAAPVCAIIHFTKNTLIQFVHLLLC